MKYPKIKENKELYQITSKLSKEEYEGLIKAASDNDRNVSGQVRAIVKQFLVHEGFRKLEL